MGLFIGIAAKVSRNSPNGKVSQGDRYRLDEKERGRKKERVENVERGIKEDRRFIGEAEGMRFQHIARDPAVDSFSMKFQTRVGR